MTDAVLTVLQGCTAACLGIDAIGLLFSKRGLVLFSNHEVTQSEGAVPGRERRKPFAPPENTGETSGNGRAMAVSCPSGTLHAVQGFVFSAQNKVEVCFNV